MSAVSPSNKVRMQQIIRRLPAVFAVFALSLFSLDSAADDAQPSDASGHLLRGEIALQQMDYLEAAREFRMAAELSSSVDIARKVTRVASSLGFSSMARRTRFCAYSTSSTCNAVTATA